MSEEGSPTSSKILSLQRGLLKVLSSNTGPYNQYWQYPGFRKTLKMPKMPIKKAENRFFDSKAWRVEGFRPEIWHHIGLDEC